MNLPKVLVLMPTYNGANFLRQQLNSIYAQKDVEIRLVIRDDASTDSTQSILGRVIENSKIILSKSRVGTIESLKLLLEHHQPGEYIAFSDQDDIWEENHLLKAITVLSEVDSNQTYLYFPEYRYIDSQSEIIGKRPRRRITGLSNAIVENPAIGCGIVLNPKAAEYLKKFPLQSNMHIDHQLYFLFSFIGEVLQGDEITVNYRLHDENQVGISRRLEAIAYPKKFLANLKELKKSQNCIFELFGSASKDAPIQNIGAIQGHFDAIYGNPLVRISYALHPVFRREKRLDQFLFRLLVCLRLDQ